MSRQFLGVLALVVGVAGFLYLENSSPVTIVADPPVTHHAADLLASITLYSWAAITALVKVTMIAKRTFKVLNGLAIALYVGVIFLTAANVVTNGNGQHEWTLLQDIAGYAVMIGMPVVDVLDLISGKGGRFVGA